MSLTSHGGSIQPINLSNSQTASTTGTATFTFQQVAQSNVWTFTVNVPGAPDTANFTLVSGATTFGTFKGANSWGPIQFTGGDQLQLTATGLVPGTQYTASVQGVNNTVYEPSIVYPWPYADSVTTSTEQIYLGTGSIPATTGLSVTVPVQPTYRSLYVVLQGTNTHPASAITVSAIGNTSAFVYNVVPVPYSSATYESVYRIPLLTLNDTAVQLQFNTASSVAITFWYGADLANVDAAVYPEGEFNVTINDADNAGSPLDAVIYGGATVTGVTTTATGNANLLSAPPTGFSYRVQSVAFYYSGTASTTPVIGRFLIGGSATQLLATVTYPYQNTVYLGGLLVNTTVVVNSSTTTNSQWTITYDLVTTPTIG